VSGVDKVGDFQPVGRCITETVTRFLLISDRKFHEQ